MVIAGIVLFSVVFYFLLITVIPFELLWIPRVQVRGMQSFGRFIGKALSYRPNRFISKMSEKPTFDYSALAPKPSDYHRLISDEESKTIARLIVIGDVHGCLNELKLLLHQCEYCYHNNDRVLLLGDLVNKGPYSAEVIQFARENNFFSIRGNHDDFALCHAFSLVPPIEGKGLLYLRSLSREDLEWLAALPYTIRIPQWKIMFVHAGLLPNCQLGQQLVGDMTTMRNIRSCPTDETKLIACSTDKVGEPWVSKWDGGLEGYHVYFGHDAKRGLQLSHFATGLDTGCAYGRSLTGIILPEKKLIQVPALQVYEPVKGCEGI